MFPFLLAVAALVLTAPASTAPVPTGAEAEAPETIGEAGPVRSAETERVADWIATTGDNAGLPYVIVDKTGGQLALFDARGEPLGDAPVLVGVAIGDDATPGIGTKNLAEIGPAEKTTPAGRFRARYGLAFGRQRVLWVDYATSVAIHPIPPKTSKRERRRTRLLSPTPDDNRITFGCINVAKVFYRKNLQPVFRKKGGYVYILPDTRSLESVFPRLRVHELAQGTAS